MVGNVVGQGIANLTGQQKGFSWTSVAAAGVGAAAGYGVGKTIGTSLGNAGYSNAATQQLSTGAGFVTAASQGIASSVASQLTQVALDGKGRLNWSSVAINGISAGVGTIAGYDDPKNGNLRISDLQASDYQAAINNGNRLAYNSDLSALQMTEPVNVTAKRLTPTERAVEEATTLATKTADRLMQVNISQLAKGTRKIDYRLPDIDAQPRIIGIVTQSALQGWRVAFNPNSNVGTRLTYGTLALAASPLALAESAAAALMNFPAAASEFGQNVARANMQTDPYERNLDTLRAITTGTEAFTGASGLFSLGKPAISLGQTAAEIAEVRAGYDLARATASQNAKNTVRTGQVGERAVRELYDIGPKEYFSVGGRDRIADGSNLSRLSEVKNVTKQSYTQQLQDYVQFANSTGRSFDLYIRGPLSPSGVTNLSGALKAQIELGNINIKFIPGTF